MEKFKVCIIKNRTIQFSKTNWSDDFYNICLNGKYYKRSTTFRLYTNLKFEDALDAKQLFFKKVNSNSENDL